MQLVLRTFQRYSPCASVNQYSIYWLIHVFTLMTEFDNFISTISSKVDVTLNLFF
jgi:hypothetical protein